MKTYDVEVDGCRLHVREAGQGPALLLLHGLSGSNVIWSRTLATYADRWRVVAPDLPGHGRSDKPVAPYTIDFYAGMLRSLGHRLGIEQAMVTGVSLGGRIALELAITYPHFTRGVAALAPANDYPILMQPIGAALRAAIHPAILRTALRRSLARAFHDPACDGAAIRLRDLEERLDAEDYPAFARAVATTIGGVLHGGRMPLHAIRQPVLLVWGRQDRIVPLTSARRLQEAIPQARLVVLDACGHLAMLERPDALHVALDEFLAAAAVAPSLPPREAVGRQLMFQIDKPLPAITEDGAPYWAAAREQRLAVQKCSACGHLRFPPSVVCPKCLAEAHEWTPLSGRGTVYSFIIVHRPQHPGFYGDAPYNVAIVELEEGIRLHSNVVDCPNEDLRIGMPVEVVFERIDDEVTLPKFRPRRRPVTA